MDESDSTPITDPATEPVNPESPSGLRLAKFLCSFGGSILPRPLDGRLRYVGGETRIITVPHDVSFSNLLLKMQEAFDGVDLIKYQQPDEDLDALVSVVNDDDLVNMMDEYDKLISCGEAFTRLRIFLFSLNQLDCETESPIYYEASERDGERRYVDALNCLIDPKTGLNSSDTEAGLTGNGSLRHLNVPRSWSAGYLSPKPFRDHSGPTSPSTVKFQVGSEEPNDPWIPDKSGFPCSLGKYVDGNGSFCENCHTPYRQYADPPHRYYTGQTGHFNCGINNNPCNENDASYHYYHNDPHGNDNRMWAPPPPPNYHRVPVPDPYMVLDGNRINYPYQHGNMYEDNNARYFNNHHVVGTEMSTNEMFHTNNSQQRYGEMESLFQVPQNVPPIPSLRRKIQPAPSPINGVINPQFGVINPQIIRGTQDGTPNGGGMINPQFGSPNGGMINTQFGTPKGGMINPQFGTLNGGSINPQFGNPNGGMINPQFGTPNGGTINPQFGNPNGGTINPQFGTPNGGTINPQFGTLNGGSINPQLGTANGGMINPQFGTLNGGSINPQFGTLNGGTINPQSGTLNGGTINPQFGTLNGGSINPQFGTLNGGTINPQSGTLNGGMINPQFGTANGGMINPPFVRVTPDGTRNGGMRVNPIFVGGIKGGFGIGTPEASPRPPLQEYNGSRLNPNGNGNGLLQCQPGTETPVPETPSPDSANPVTPLSAKSVKEPEKEIETESLVVPNGNEERQTGEESNVCLSEVVESAKNISLQGDVAKEEQINADEAEKTKAGETDSSHAVSPVEDHDEQSGDADHEAETEGHEEQEKDTSKIESSSAEQEARDKGLQTIKNEDLEEVRELGHGTYGSVFHGKWRGSDVAIKKIKASCFAGRPSEREKLIADFWKEAYILSLLHHPNVVSFYGVVRDGPDGSLATVTEFMVNGSLKQFLHKKDRTIDRRKRLIIAMDAAFGMEYLHGKNIVHFDLKCENLLVNMRDPQRPVCKIGDLGLSKIKQHTLVSGGVRGTLPWMAPELLSGKSNMVSEKIDVYSFGICMWELLTGEEPYAEMPTASIIGDLINNTLRPVIPTWCDPEWKSLMQTCWESDPTQRPSFSDISQKLRKMASAVNVK